MLGQIFANGDVVIQIKGQRKMNQVSISNTKKQGFFFANSTRQIGCVWYYFALLIFPNNLFENGYDVTSHVTIVAIVLFTQTNGNT